MLVLLKYVEANPKRAKIVNDCIDFKYSSAKQRVDNNAYIIDDVPIILPSNWLEFINSDENKVNLDSIRNSIDRQSPLGDESWKYEVSKSMA